MTNYTCHRARLAVLIWILAACSSSQAQGQGQAADTIWERALPGNRPQPIGIDFGAVGLLHGTLVFTGEGGVMYTVTARRPDLDPPWLGGVATASAEEGGLATPTLLPEWPDFNPVGLALSADERSIVVGSTLPREYPDVSPFGLFLAHRTPTGWTVPRLIDSTYTAVHGSGYPSLARDGTLYFTAFGKHGAPPPRKRMARAEPVRDSYGDAVQLTGGINDSDLRLDDPWVDPDERFMLLTGGAQETPGWRDVFVSRRLPDGGWGAPESLAAYTGGNGDHFDRFPSISPDGRLLTWLRTYGPSFGPDVPVQYWWVSTAELGLP